MSLNDPLRSLAFEEVSTVPGRCNAHREALDLGIAEDGHQVRVDLAGGRFKGMASLASPTEAGVTNDLLRAFPS